MAPGESAYILLLSALLAPVAARAGGATDFSCTVESLLAGAECVLESDAPEVPPAGRARQVRANVRAMAALADRVCPQVSRRRAGAAPDRDVVAFCRRLFADETPRCDAGGVRALLDRQDRFAPEARRCYAALVQAAARTRTVSASSARCCRCLAEARCIESFQSCAEDPLSVTADSGACVADQCAAACATYRPPPPRAADVAPAGDAGPRAAPREGDRGEGDRGEDRRDSHETTTIPRDSTAPREATDTERDHEATPGGR